MPHPFPTLNEQRQPHAWAIAPNADALKSLAEGIWTCAKQTNQRPLVVLSTAGPLMGVRARGGTRGGGGGLSGSEPI